MSYRQVLDDAIGDSPVSTIDVDAIITRQRRAGKLRRWGACGAGAVAVLAVTATAAQVLPGRTLMEPPADGPRITTVAGTPADLSRLDNAVVAALQREVPGLTWRDVASPGTPDWTHAGGEENTLVGYSGRGAIAVGGAEAHVMVRIDRHGARQTSGWKCAEADATCRESTGPHGERVWTRSTAAPAEQPDRISHRRVDVLRPADDTLVGVTLTVESAPDGIPAMTAEQQTAIALDPAIALAPVPPGVAATTPARPEKPVGSARQQRIDHAVFASLRRQAPDVRDPVDWTYSGGDNSADAYWGQGRLVVNGVAGLFSVQMNREDDVMTCGRPTGSYACKAGTGPHGERYRTVTNTTRKGSTTSATRDVSVLRKDGSWLLVSLNANPPDGKFPLTAAEQQAVAFDPAVTL